MLSRDLGDIRKTQIKYLEMKNIRGMPPQTDFTYKKLCTFSYMFKLQAPSKYSLFDAIDLSRHYFPLLQTVFELVGTF